MKYARNKIAKAPKEGYPEINKELSRTFPTMNAFCRVGPLKFSTWKK